jgi:hypothetical protein
MKTYAVSMIANLINHTKGSQTIRHKLSILYATSEEEAVGKGFKMIHIDCPTDDGWQGYDVVVLEAEIK